MRSGYSDAGRSAIGALALFVTWTFATWLLEGRIETLLRPDAAFDRALYAVVANLLIGTVGAVLLLRWVVRLNVLEVASAGFGSSRRAWISVALGLALGGALYILQGGPVATPTVVVNAYAQVLVVSVAEVLVCWAVVGAIVERVLQQHSRTVAVIGAGVVASVLFGIYHVAHSPPFNSAFMVGLLTVVGLVTALFFFISRDVYGTIVFHNCLGVFGVVQALQSSDRLDTLKEPQPVLLVMALIAIGALVITDRIWLRPVGSVRPAVA